MEHYLAKFVICIVVSLIGRSIFAGDNVRYQRASVISMMIERPMNAFNAEIEDAFLNTPLSNRFNDHSLGPRIIKFATFDHTDQLTPIHSFLAQTNLATRAVAKWFGYDQKSTLFNMNLVMERGLYNASATDWNMANLTVRGKAILKDAGENLISNTYLLIHDICYSGSYDLSWSQRDNVGDIRSFSVTITSYIYQLEWNDINATNFYSTYYNGCSDFTQVVHEYNFVHRATVETNLAEQSKTLNQSSLIHQVVARAIEINISKLQKTYPDFRIKSTITNVYPFEAEVGLKEGITEASRFEVLEMECDEETGIVSYVRVGIVRPKKEKIMDNRYYVDSNDIPTDIKMTEFEIVEGHDFYPGMVIREI